MAIFSLLFTQALQLCQSNNPVTTLLYPLLLPLAQKSLSTYYHEASHPFVPLQSPSKGARLWTTQQQTTYSQHSSCQVGTAFAKVSLWGGGKWSSCLSRGLHSPVPLVMVCCISRSIAPLAHTLGGLLTKAMGRYWQAFRRLNVVRLRYLFYHPRYLRSRTWPPSRPQLLPPRLGLCFPGSIFVPATSASIATSAYGQLFLSLMCFPKRSFLRLPHPRLPYTYPWVARQLLESGDPSASRDEKWVFCCRGG